MSDQDRNAAVIEAEIAWFERLLDLRFQIHGGEVEEEAFAAALSPPPLPAEPVAYAEGVRALSPAERLVTILAMLPHLKPQALDPLLIENQSAGRRFTEFGGTTSGPHSGFRPTRQTTLFLLAGEEMAARLAAMDLFRADAPLQELGVLDPSEEPMEAGPWAPLIVSPEWIDRLTGAGVSQPISGPGYLTQRLTTAYEWDDLVLTEEVREEVEAICGWAWNHQLLMEEWGLGRHVKPGYRALFFGPPGTGKTVTAAVLGKCLGLPVWRLDLSGVVSKWVGETEKNLRLLFDRAEAGGMILFFDEADALFGKRGEARLANDRHAYQQLAYLLQRIEDCPAITILASSRDADFDEGFAHRFQAMVHFQMPDAQARLLLWQRAFAGVPGAAEGEIDFPGIAREAVLAGGAIANVVRHVCIRAATGDGVVTEPMVWSGIERELARARHMGA